MTGFFTGDATFGEVGGTPVNLISNGLWDIFVAKYGPDGTLAWAKKVGGTSYDFGWGIAVDTNSNVYVTGNFYTTATFGDGENQITFTNTGFLDIFVAKYGSDGTLAWAKQIEGSLFAPTIAVEGNGNSYVTGQFSGTATFGELPGQILTSAGSGANTFLAKYDTDGTLAWAKQAGSSMGEGVTVDSSGNSYVTGTFWGTAAFGEPGSQTILTSTYPADAFVAKYGTDGTLVWAKKVCGTGGMYGIGLAVAVDGSGNSYVTGSFLDTATFIEGASQKILTSKGGQDIYVAKYGPNGTLASAIQAGGGANDIGFGIAVSGYWNIYVAGDFRDTATFGEVEGVPVNLTGKGSSDIFLAKYTSGGFVGFFDPIQTGPEVINLVKAGRAIPVKFQLQNESGGFIDDLSAVTEISFQQMVCSDGSLPILLADLGGTETSRSSRLWYDYSTNQFIYLWKTTKDMAGNCYRLNVELFDSEVHSADFQMW